MFDSLDEQMKHDEQAEVSSREKMIRWLAIVVVSILLFGGLFFGVRLLS